MSVFVFVNKVVILITLSGLLVSVARKATSRSRTELSYPKER